MSQDWYYSVDGGREGPVSSGELKKKAEAGVIKATDLVWKDGMADWVPAKSIKGLFSAGGSPTPSGGTAAKTGEQPAAAAAAAEEDERPSSRGRPRDEEDEDRPRRRRDEDDAEDRPRSRRREEEAGADNEDRPVRRRRFEDDEDDRPRKRKRGGRVPEDTANKKMVAGLLGILLGAWGIHKFYLGMTTAGILQIVITVCTCFLASFIGLIEGIIYLTKSDEEFYQLYIVEKKAWF